MLQLSKEIKYKLFILITLFFCSSPIFSKTSIAKVIATRGQVNTQSKQIQRGSPLFVGDKIQTSEEASAQIRYTDGTIVSIAPNSIYKIDQYQFNHDPKTDKRQASLFKGGIRVLTGIISKKNDEAVSLITRAVIIGVRGTYYTAIDEGNTTYFSATEGVACAKQLCVGTGFSTNAFVAKISQRPQRIDHIPLPVLQRVISPIIHRESSSSTNNFDQSNPSEQSGSEEYVASDSLQTSVGDIPIFENPNLQINDITDVVGISQQPLPVFAIAVENVDFIANQPNDSLFAGPVDPNTITALDTLAVNFPRTSIPGGFIEGTSVLSSPKFIPNTPLLWGEWGSANCTSGFLCSGNSALSHSVLWISGISNNLNDLPKSGTVVYNKLRLSEGNGSEGRFTTSDLISGIGIRPITSRFNIDFTTGNVTGFLHVVDKGGFDWITHPLNGQLIGGTSGFEINPVQGVFNFGPPNSFSGKIVGIFAGEQAQGLAFGYQFRDVSGSHFVNGIGLFGR